MRDKISLLILLAMAAVVQAGCNSRTTYQVTGRVQYKDGSPITGGARFIRLEPTDDTTAEIRKTASGTIGEDGAFEMFTRRPGDGVIPGKYVVTFTVLDKLMGGKHLIPFKYSDPTQSPYQLEVDEDKSDLVYELEKL